MPINGMELGSDLQLTITDNVAGQLTINILTSADIKQITKQIKSTSLAGKTLYAELPEGWGIDLDFNKADSKLLDYVARNEAAYFSGQQVGIITMSATIMEVSGAKSRYRFTGGALKLTNGGMFKGLDIATAKASVMFSRMYKVQ